MRARCGPTVRRRASSQVTARPGDTTRFRIVQRRARLHRPTAQRFLPGAVERGLVAGADVRVCSAGVDGACCGLTEAKDPQVTYRCARPAVAHHCQRQVVLGIGPTAGAAESEMAIGAG